MKFLFISLGLMTLAVQIFCEDSISAPTEIRVANEVPAETTVVEPQPVHEQSQTDEKKLTKRSFGWGPWGWPEYSYGWPWPGWGGVHGGYGGHGGGWYGGWYGGHGWPWWYSGHGGGWHGKW